MKKRLQSLRELWQRIKRNWRTRYKLVVKNEETQSEPFSLKLSPQNIFVIVTTSAVVLIVLTAMLIAFTPLRIYVPGYTTPDEYRLYKKVAKRVDSAEYLIKLQRQYIQNLNYILNDKTDDAMAAVKGEKSNATLTVGNHPDEDAQLQQEAEDIVQRLSVRHAPSLAANVRKADVSDLEALKGIFDDIAELDVLINNAGISYVGLLSDMTEEEWNRIVAVNLTSVFYTSKLAVKKMLSKHSGSIINISSVWGNVGASMEVAYSATKGGVNGFTKALAKELAPSNISVNAIACGFVDTDMNRHLSEEDLEAVKTEIPADRFATCEEIADSVYSVLTAPSYLTGQVITVDGGWT